MQSSRSTLIVLTFFVACVQIFIDFSLFNCRSLSGEFLSEALNRCLLIVKGFLLRNKTVQSKRFDIEGEKIRLLSNFRLLQSMKYRKLNKILIVFMTNF